MRSEKWFLFPQLKTVKIGENIMTNMQMSVSQVNKKLLKFLEGHLRWVGSHPDVNDDDLKFFAKDFYDFFVTNNIELLFCSTVYELVQIRNEYAKKGSNKRNKGSLVFELRSKAMSKSINALQEQYPDVFESFEMMGEVA
jgi:hypothetical protein